MARLAAIAKGLYYPTPLRVVAGLADLIRLDSQPNKIIRILDPCAGTGSAALLFARMLVSKNPQQLNLNVDVPGKTTVRLYGIELDKERAALAKPHYYQFLSTNTLSSSIEADSFDLIFHNPPYNDSGDDDKRLEMTFTEKMTRSLRLGGLLVNIIPRSVMPLLAKHHASWYSAIKVYRFPDPEFINFKQVVVIGQKKKWVMDKGTITEQLEKVQLYDHIDILPCPDGLAATRIITMNKLPLNPDVEIDLATYNRRKLNKDKSEEEDDDDDDFGDF